MAKSVAERETTHDNEIRTIDYEESSEADSKANFLQQNFSKLKKEGLFIAMEAISAEIVAKGVEREHVFEYTTARLR